MSLEKAPESPPLTPEKEEALVCSPLTQEIDEIPDTPPLTPDEQAPDGALFALEKEEAPGVLSLTQEAPDSALLTSEKNAALDSDPITPDKEEAPDSPSLTPENSTLSPPIWSVFRGGIYETLPYYRAYNGGLYSSDLLAKGFLIDKQKDVRDFLDAQVIITSL